MVQFKDAQTYFAQSKLLIQARPSTTRITTKYTVPKPRPSSRNRVQKSSSSSTDATPATASGGEASAPAAPRATMTLKTYDPVSGTCLKYQTDKQAEVGRLIAGLGRLARDMAALPEAAPTAAAGVDEVAAGGDGTATPMEVDAGVQAQAAAATGAQGGGKPAGAGGAGGGGQQQQQQQQQQGGGGKKGKKKGKK